MKSDLTIYGINIIIQNNKKFFYSSIYERGGSPLKNKIEHFTEVFDFTFCVPFRAVDEPERFARAKRRSAEGFRLRKAADSLA